jgi:hypothetical protein
MVDPPGQETGAVSWLDHIDDRVNDLLRLLERIAVALERIAEHQELGGPYRIRVRK